jgi:lipopolysaccharide/colanic/teichoic acid biosynthesis glycosyltransferase
MAELAAAFSLFGLDITYVETAPACDAAASYRAGAPPQPPANDDVPSPIQADPVPFRRRVPRLPPQLPVRLMQLIDWLAAATAAQAAAMWGAGASLAELAIGDAAAFILSAGALKAGLWLTGVYRSSAASMRPDHSAGGLALGAVLGLLFAAAYAPDMSAVAALAALIPATALILALIHAALAVLTAAAWRAGVFSDSVAIIGATPGARRFINAAAQSGEARIVGVFDDRRARGRAKWAGPAVNGTVADLLAWEELPHVDRIVIAVTGSQARQRALLELLSAVPNRVDSLEEGAAGCASVCVAGAPHRHGRAFAKRAFDFAFGAALLAVFALPMLAIAAVVCVDAKGPALVRTPAYGRNNRVFSLAKFRTARDQSENPTRVGSVLRRTRLDDLPQILNVLAGDMSIVGPRPHRVGHARLPAAYAQRHRVKPGLIGWAHVNGEHGPARTPAASRKRLRLDADYAARASLLFDAHILVRAVCAAFSPPHISRM